MPFYEDDNTLSSADDFANSAGTVVLEVDKMQIEGDDFTFRLPNARTVADSIQQADRVVVTMDKEKFLEDPNQCAHVTVSLDDMESAGYNFFTDNAKIAVANLDQSELEQAQQYGCAVAHVDLPEQDFPDGSESGVLLASNNVVP